MCLSLSSFFLYVGQYGKPLSKYIRHYEGLSYDTDVLHSKHQRAKRALPHQDQFLHLDFHAHGRSAKPVSLFLLSCCFWKPECVLFWLNTSPLSIYEGKRASQIVCPVKIQFFCFLGLTLDCST